MNSAEKIKRKDLMKLIIAIAIIIVAGMSMWCLTFLLLAHIVEESEVTVSVSIPEEIITPPPISEKTTKILYDNKQVDFRADVERFLINDLINNNIYDNSTYWCVHFSNDLVINMHTAGFNAHKLTLRTEGEIGHMMVFVYGPDSNLIVEPITDQVFGINDEIDEYFYDILGYYPEIISIQP